MVAGHLAVKSGKYYAVLNYKNAKGERKRKVDISWLARKGQQTKSGSRACKAASGI